MWNSFHGIERIEGEISDACGNEPVPAHSVPVREMGEVLTSHTACHLASQVWSQHFWLCTGTLQAFLQTM